MRVMWHRILADWASSASLTRTFGAQFRGITQGQGLFPQVVTAPYPAGRLAGCCTAGGGRPATGNASTTRAVRRIATVRMRGLGKAPQM